MPKKIELESVPEILNEAAAFNVQLAEELTKEMALYSETLEKLEPEEMDKCVIPVTFGAQALAMIIASLENHAGKLLDLSQSAQDELKSRSSGIVKVPSLILPPSVTRGH